MGEPEDEDWKILEDNDSELIIGFKYRKENLPHKYKFLAQCKGKVFVNKDEKRLDKVEFYNTEPVKIKIFNVDKLDMVVTYKVEEGTKTYLIETLDDFPVPPSTTHLKFSGDFNHKWSQSTLLELEPTQWDILHPLCHLRCRIFQFQLH